MLGNSPFYFKTTEKITAAFGWIFSDISIVRTDGTTTKTIKVPIEQAAKQKWDVRDRQDPNAGDEPNQKHVAIVLPRMGYELTGWRYDSHRKLPSVNYRVKETGSNQTLFKQLNPVPIIFNYSLYYQTKNLEDGWQIAEQIIPFFTPDFVVPIIDIPEMSIKRDIVFTLVGQSKTDSYEGSFLDKRILEWQFDFEARGHMYPPIRTKKAITEADINVEGDLVKATIAPPTAQANEPFDIVLDY